MRDMKAAVPVGRRACGIEAELDMVSYLPTRLPPGYGVLGKGM
jgi:hypothetical protein